MRQEFEFKCKNHELGTIFKVGAGHNTVQNL